MATQKIILTVLVLLIEESWVHSQNVATYEHKLPSGRKVLCRYCPPGSHLQKHCTETQPTKCRVCNVGFYTEYSNYIYDCLPCTQCTSDQVMIQECTSTSNRVCGCKEGFFWKSDMCWPHTVCPSGYRVKENGTSVSDTVCEACPNGYYSGGEPGNTECIPRTECKSGEKLLFLGTDCLDNVCVTCNNITYDGWLKHINRHFIEIFKNHSCPSLTLFITTRLKNSKRVRVLRSDTHHDAWIQYLEQWLHNATEKQVSKLPKRLKRFGMKDLAEDIRNKIEKIQEEVNKCR